MILNILLNLLQQPEAKHGHGAGDAFNAGEFIMHHISDHVIVELPTIYGVNLSITKHVLMMWVAAALLLLVLVPLFRKKRPVPQGMANAFEAIVVFFREDIVFNYLGEQGKRYEPFLYTAFFFILICNLLGLVPGAAAPTGNIGVTSAMAGITFLIGLFGGMRKYGPIGFFTGMIPKGIPVLLIPLMFVVELMGLITRHFALAIRLFANMTAGHVVIFALISLIFIFESYVVAPLPIVGAIGIGLLEVLVALIQAYIFTLLSAVFIGLAIQQEH